MRVHHILVIAISLLMGAAVAAADTTVELVGRVNSTNLTSGPWGGVRVGEYVHLQYTLTPSTIIDPDHARNYTFAGFGGGGQINPLFQMTVRGQTMNMVMSSAANPSVVNANDYPIADVHMVSVAGDGLIPMALPASPPTVQYGMIMELHDSTGTAFNAADLSVLLGSYGPTTFDTVDWSVSVGNQGFGISLVRMVIRSTTDATGACCLGDGWCAVTGQAACIGTWSNGAPCGQVSCAPAGACCKGNGSCELLTQAACESILDAVYEGDNTTCSSGLCPPTGGCCVAGSCTLLTDAACRRIGGVWQGAGTNCSIQPQFSQTTAVTLPDATGGLNGNPVVPGVYTGSIFVNDPGTVQTIEVWLSIIEQRMNDYRIRITGPNGVTLDLVNRIGSPAPCTTTPIGPGYAANGTIIFQDSAATSLYAHVLSLPTNSLITGGRFKASGCVGSPVSLDAPSPAGFSGIPKTGTWTLEIRDERTGVTGYLGAWALSFNGGNAAPCAIPCGGADWNNDGAVTPSDVASFVNAWYNSLQAGTLTADYNHNGSIEPADVATFINAWFAALSNGC